MVSASTGQSDRSTGQSDRDAKGRFGPGNKVGKTKSAVAKLRSAWLSAVTEDDCIAAMRKLIELAKAGDTKALAIMADRTGLKAGWWETAEAIEKLEAAMDAMTGGEWRR